MQLFFAQPADPLTVQQLLCYHARRKRSRYFLMIRNNGFVGNTRTAERTCMKRPPFHAQERYDDRLAYWTSADLDAFPENGMRYEIIDGVLHVSNNLSGAINLLVCG